MALMYRMISLIFAWILTFHLTDQSGVNSQNKSASNACFCKLHGEIDDCGCNVQSVDLLNNHKIYPILKSLVAQDYFRYIKVNLHKECPFWRDDSRCALKDCHVTSCPQEELPEGLKNDEMFETTEDKHTENKYTEEAQEEPSCAEEIELSALDTTISEKSQKAFKDWKSHDDKESKFCEIDDDNSSDCHYVDLLLNPERYTGYRGASPRRIWRSIYEENCFKPQEIGYGSLQSTSGLCLEERIFYRLISGLHTSINLHLCANYLYPPKGIKPAEWKPNLKEFQKRFGPDKTKGYGPQRLKNLYFTYLVELRALAKVAPYLENETFYTGNEDYDVDVKQGVKELLKVVKSFPHHFDESMLFQGNPKEAKKLKEEFRSHFMNISRIMDCVGCDKCKLWGKVQIQGMGTALKILFSGDNIQSSSLDSKDNGKKFQLRRTEIVALINAFARLSSSVHTVEKFRQMLS